MDPLNRTKIRPLMNISSGIPEIAVGMIDGPVDFSHPALKRSKIATVKKSQLVACREAKSLACMHGTFVAGILCAMRGLNAPGICPSCKIIIYPIFSEKHLSANEFEGTMPSSTPEELSKAIVETINAGAKIVNLSLGSTSSSLTRHQRLKETYDYALRKGVILVAAAGNQGNIGDITMLDHPWPIPVAGCDIQGRIEPTSNFGHSIRKRGLMAPSLNITSTGPGGEYTQMSGTSVAAPFVTGTIALLWSIFPEAPAYKIIRSLVSNKIHNRTIIPPLLDGYKAYQLLQQDVV